MTWWPSQFLWRSSNKSVNSSNNESTTPLIQGETSLSDRISSAESPTRRQRTKKQKIATGVASTVVESFSTMVSRSPPRKKYPTAKSPNSLPREVPKGKVIVDQPAMPSKVSEQLVVADERLEDGLNGMSIVSLIKCNNQSNLVLCIIKPQEVSNEFPPASSPVHHLNSPALEVPSKVSEQLVAPLMDALPNLEEPLSNLSSIDSLPSTLRIYMSPLVKERYKTSDDAKKWNYRNNWSGSIKLAEKSCPLHGGDCRPSAQNRIATNQRVGTY